MNKSKLKKIKAFEQENLTVFRKNYSELITDMQIDVCQLDRKFSRFKELFDKLVYHRWSEDETTLELLESIITLLDDCEFLSIHYPAIFSNLYQHLKSILNLKKGKVIE